MSMFERIPVSGTFIGKKRSQINTINHLLKKIEHGLAFDIEEAEDAYQRLSGFYFTIMKSNKASSSIKSWFAQHPLYEIRNIINTEIENRYKEEESIAGNGNKYNISQLKFNFLNKLNSSRSVEQFYQRMDTPKSFRSILENILTEEVDVPFRISTLGGENNEVLLVTIDDQEDFVCRIFKVLQTEIEEDISAKQAREALVDVIYVVQPFDMKEINQADKSEEVVYLEYSDYYPKGNLENYFRRLHNDPSTTLEEIQNDAFEIAIQITDFYQQIAIEGIWYTDLKPSNLLLSEDNGIRLSDVKGLLKSKQRKVPIHLTNTTKNYISSSVFDKNNQIDLLSVQRKTFAASLYQLLCNKLPKQQMIPSDSSFEWRLKFDFNQSVFQNDMGEFYKDLIRKLYKGKIHSFEQCMEALESYATDHLSSLKM